MTDNEHRSGRRSLLKRGTLLFGGGALGAIASRAAGGSPERTAGSAMQPQSAGASARMQRTALNPDSLHTPFSRYAHGIQIEGPRRFIFCAGQVAGDAEGKLVGRGDFWAQGHKAMENLAAVLAEGGASFADIVKATIYVVGTENAQAGRDLGGQYFDPERPPANTLVVCAGLADPEFLVEVEAIAVI
ncbi:MAG: RidA family protein [Longimicrobiales bacterium]|nr:RidA family protein [Longimicrobiales bacterium]